MKSVWRDGGWNSEKEAEAQDGFEGGADIGARAMGKVRAPGGSKTERDKYT